MKPGTHLIKGVLERLPLLEGVNQEAVRELTTQSSLLRAARGQTIVRRGGWPAFLSGLGLVAAGALVGLIASALTLWDRLMSAFGTNP